MKKDIEKALKEFLMDVRITGEERKKGIPIITFVYKEEDRAVLLKALPLPLADIQTEKKIPAGKEVLYRVDFFKEGEAKVSFGVLPVVKESAPFLTLLENAIESGDRKAGLRLPEIPFSVMRAGSPCQRGIIPCREEFGTGRGKQTDRKNKWSRNRSAGQIHPCQYRLLP